ncbi:Elicitor-like transglutaminase [Phytophthora cinnamomi]|uniref:Elicitor-like transglutaminase n=1 Tax=Phytophthora cinnamomi TaxID=4785 RepID=UPI00355A6747|nr:Elicitor-like transglutaminase [Phytophthora cinnamomi]
MSSTRPTPPWLGYSVLALALLPSTIQGEAITESVVTPLGDTASLTHSHPAFGGLQTGKVVAPVVLTEQNGDAAATRNLEAELSDISRLETYFGTSMETNFNVIKDSYSSAVRDVLPWSGDYWATYKDGVNVVWKDGDASPTEKYAAAFGINVNSFKDSISLSTGVLSEADYESACTSDADCDDGSLCGIREGDTSGYCIPTWHGICHAWAAAALYEAEPKCDVQKDNVTFHSVDMKALISQLYDGAAIEVVFTGARFNGPDSPEELDEYGRYVDDARRDINPAFFHIAAANILGKQQRSFIVDVSSDSQVWNQPVQKYEFLEADIVDAANLSLEHFGTETYPFNSGLTYLAKCTMRLTWTAESIEDGALTTTGRIEAYTVYEDYEYCLELDENYTIVGGEWLGDSRKDHPDFLWFPAAKPSADTVTDSGIAYADVLGLIEQSLECVDVTISPDAPDAPSTKTPGSEYTKSPSYTKTPSKTTKTPTATTTTPSATTYTPPTSIDSSAATEAPEPTTKTPEPYTYAPEPTTEQPYTTTPEPYTAIDPVFGVTFKLSDGFTFELPDRGSKCDHCSPYPDADVLPNVGSQHDGDDRANAGTDGYTNLRPDISADLRPDINTDTDFNTEDN